ncbi:putative RNA recognition motif (a k a RRM RBD or RNP domain) [Trypanosoma vivax]|uniref:Putative RNA-binding protein n=1 Tax=Trypanosoma vivax (strain Y486) TaxID=1055687 RepID=G0TXB1_TRYVY|nr:putative RNA recognition motif (a k a RRM RBD or RNP domain) [Trypanosoma vivax]CCC48601.1 putative RNA-binding protein [Trypanosoma vivax Y486]
MSSTAVLFVGNLPTVANAQFVERLFSAYGDVKHVDMLWERQALYAEVTYSTVDDADSAIAALHWRYCAAKGVPLVVLYHVKSPSVSDYGRRVGRKYAEASMTGCSSLSGPLESFSTMLPCSEAHTAHFNRDTTEGTAPEKL